jgi:hypothetical protein
MDAIAFQKLSAAAFSELRSALGDGAGELWLIPGLDERLRLQVGVAGAGDPPAGPSVLAAKLVLDSHGLADRADLVAVRRSTAEFERAFDRVSAVLGGMGAFARVSLRSQPFGWHQTLLPTRFLVIETPDGINDQQQAIVDAAVAAAGMRVQVQPTLGPGPEFTPYPAVEVEWAPLSVRADGRSLLLGYRWGHDVINQPSLSLDESDREIRMGIALPDANRYPDPDRVRTADVFQPVGNLVVKLGGPIAGRRITGPRCSLGGETTNFAYNRPRPLRAGTPRRRVPRVVDLAPDDAINLLRLQGFAPESTGHGIRVIEQDPEAEQIMSAEHASVSVVIAD